jgi:glutaredoxin-like protein NrdH
MKVQLYALSTCAWCKKTKKFLEDNAIEYELHDVDLLHGEEKDQIKSEVAKHNPRLSYPTIVVDEGKEVLVGFDAERLKEVLGV